MPIEVRIPRVGESITEVRLGDWRVSEGDAVAVDDVLIEIESEKATFDLPSPAAGVVSRIVHQPGETVGIDEVIALIDESAKPARKSAGPAKKQDEKESPPQPAKGTASSGRTSARDPEPRVMPAAARALAESGLKPGQATPTGPGGRLLKEDVERAARAPAEPAAPRATASRPLAGSREDEVVPMTLLRRRIAERLVQAGQTAALLTTFNEVDLSAVNDLRARHKDAFAEKHGVKLGFMSFFVKAAVDALEAFPLVNAEIRGTDVVYHRYCDIGVAIGGGKGLVVPVLRNAERLSFAEIEQAIADFAQRAKSNALTPDELQGGTFTISNGGVYGSMLSTPIVNPPQSGVLGMHSIQDRPVARNGQVVIRPMMYIALTYDHRIVDGREAVSFLRRIKETIEEPARLLLEV